MRCCPVGVSTWFVSMADAPNASVSRSVSDVSITDAAIATPTAPPSWRMKFTSPVATPICGSVDRVLRRQRRRHEDQAHPGPEDDEVDAQLELAAVDA